MLIDRGNCSFSQKLYNAQQAGFAAGIVVCIVCGRHCVFLCSSRPLGAFRFDFTGFALTTVRLMSYRLHRVLSGEQREQSCCVLHGRRWHCAVSSDRLDDDLT